MEMTTIGLDLAKHDFQVHAITADGTVLKKRLRRGQVHAFFAALKPCLVGMGACGHRTLLGSPASSARPRRPAYAGTVRRGPRAMERTAAVGRHGGSEPA